MSIYKYELHTPTKDELLMQHAIQTSQDATRRVADCLRLSSIPQTAIELAAATGLELALVANVLDLEGGLVHAGAVVRVGTGYAIASGVSS